MTIANVIKKTFKYSVITVVVGGIALIAIGANGINKADAEATQVELELTRCRGQFPQIDALAIKLQSELDHAKKASSDVDKEYRKYVAMSGTGLKLNNMMTTCLDMFPEYSE
ncbi:hypothetical protein [Moritella viscosa]|uniref:Acetyl-coenzyme A carboxylase carboxyl transferase subunit beta n=1 Tax=Moritella viscosa TaxID=80854 RepID=A0A1L0APP3_9GAMM|nr:hypothetical protein [Moritella viscosa]SGZ16557.1 Acetyl-coenzyme A carboxylase carboxyl transferase subunit beta [Moritella viscosa]